MSWLKIDDGFAENAKVSELSDRAFRLHVTALCFCARNLTDGYLSTKTVRVLGALMDRNIRSQVTELVEAGLWLRTAVGYTINDYLEFNPSAAKVKETRKELSAARRAAGKKGADKRWQTNGKQDGKPDSNGDGKPEVLSIAPSPPLLKTESPSLREPSAQDPKPRVRITDHDTPKPIEFAVQAQLAQARKAAREEASA